MTVNELIEKLSALSSDQRELRVCVHDGLDPSDVDEATWIEVAPHYSDKIPCVEIH